MTVSKVRLSRRANDEFGQTGINEMCRHLYAVSCQTCGQDLGVRPPSVTVDDYGTYVQVQLHHEMCKKPQWTERAAVTLDFRAPALLTYRVRHLVPSHSLFPGLQPGTPWMLLNPGLEAATLERVGRAWRVTTVDRYVHHGLQVARLGEPARQIAGSFATLRRNGDGSEPWLRVGLATGHRWEVSMDHFVAVGAQRVHGLVLIVTSARDPGALGFRDFGSPELIDLIKTGQCAAGWVPLTVV